MTVYDHSAPALGRHPRSGEVAVPRNRGTPISGRAHRGIGEMLAATDGFVLDSLMPNNKAPPCAFASSSISFLARSPILGDRESHPFLGNTSLNDLFKLPKQSTIQRHGCRFGPQTWISPAHSFRGTSWLSWTVVARWEAGRVTSIKEIHRAACVPSPLVVWTHRHVIP